MQTKRGDVGRKTHHFLRTGSYHRGVLKGSVSAELKYT